MATYAPQRRRARISCPGSNVLINDLSDSGPALLSTRTNTSRLVTPLSARRNCVRTVSDTPRDPGQIPRFTGTVRCTSLLREVVDGECVGEIWCASVCVEGLAFQACSFNHSDISPFRINHLRIPNRAEGDLCPRLCPNPIGVSTHFNRLRAIALGARLRNRSPTRGSHHPGEHAYCAVVLASAPSRSTKSGWRS